MFQFEGGEFLDKLGDFLPRKKDPYVRRYI
jgi:hypothetical protein